MAQVWSWNERRVGVRGKEHTHIKGWKEEGAGEGAQGGPGKSGRGRSPGGLIPTLKNEQRTEGRPADLCT